MAAILAVAAAPVVVAGLPARAIEVRVLLDEAVSSVEVAGENLVVRTADGETVAEGGGSIRLAPRPGGVAVGPAGVRGAVVVEADGPVRALLHRWRGRLVVEPAGRALRVLNELDVEEYLRGVVPLEMPHHWPAAALEAQAIAARTYALARALDTAVPFLDKGVADQVYGGVEVERPATDSAVAATAGRVLLWNGRPFVSYFHSTCGGHTDAPPDALGRDGPPRHGVPDTYCAASPYYAPWEATVRGTVRPVRIAPGGRMSMVEWDGRRMTGNEFRLAVGPTRLRSVRAVVEDGGAGRTRLVGRGWGHGAGLCQWGARGRAEAGASAEAILLHYYPGATIGGLPNPGTEL